LHDSAIDTHLSLRGGVISKYPKSVISDRGEVYKWVTMALKRADIQTIFEKRKIRMN